MAETLTIRSERVDDLPLLLAPLDRTGVQPHKRALKGLHDGR